MQKTAIRERPDKDTFETPDPAGPPQGLVFEPANTSPSAVVDEVETQRLNPGKALNIFTSIDAGSSGLRKRSLRTQTEFAYLPQADRKFESPLQRYTRLAAEMKEFLADLDTVSKSSKQPIEQNVTAEELSAEVRSMALELENALHKQPATAAAPKAISALTEKIAKEIQAIDKQSSKDLSTSGSPLTYELYFTPENRSQSTAVDLSSLDKRLSRLETAIGQAPQALPEGGLLRTIMELQQKLALLDDNRLEAIITKAKAVTAEADAATRRTDVSSDNHIAKLNELYELTNRWDRTAQALPTIADRLRAVKIVHDDAATVSTTVRQLETDRAQLAAACSSNAELLAQLQRNFKANLDAMQTNIQQLEARVTALAAKSQPKVQ